MDGATYEQWVAGYDVETGAAKGRLRTDDQAVRFVEVTVNGPKTWSLAAALHPEIAAAYDAAQMAAAEEIIGWLASHATTRVGPRGRQVQVPVEQIEAAVVRHFTSRAGDPHRHLHLQINARVLGGRRVAGLHTVGVRDSLEAINGIGHAAVMTNPEFRAALAAHGYTLDPETGEVARAGAVRRRVQRAGTTDRDQHRPLRGRMARVTTPARSPARRCGRRGTAGRGRTPAPTRSSRSRERTCATRWVEELHDLGFRRPASQRQSRRTADRVAGPRRAGRAGRSTGSAPAAPPGTRPTPAARSRS